MINTSNYTLEWFSRSLKNLNCLLNQLKYEWIIKDSFILKLFVILVAESYTKTILGVSRGSFSLPHVQNIAFLTKFNMAKCHYVGIIIVDSKMIPVVGIAVVLWLGLAIIFTRNVIMFSFLCILQHFIGTSDFDEFIMSIRVVLMRE